MKFHQHLIKRLLTAVALVCLLTILGIVNADQYTTIERVSVATPNGQTDRGGQRPAINHDGSKVAFWSDSSIMAPGDTNNTGDIFLRDVNADTTIRVNVGPSAAQANDLTFAEIDIDNGGNLIAFASNAKNLIASDNNNFTDVFVYDNGVKATARVSLAPGGAEANGASFRPVISGNGLLVAFRSNATNLVANDTNGLPDIFLFDRSQGQTARVNVAGDGTQANAEDPDAPNRNIALGFDGRYIAFDTRASNLVANDNNNVSDVFVHSRSPQGNTTVRVSVSSAGVQGNAASYYPSMSDNGRYIVFESTASNLVANDTNGRTDIFLHDRDTNANGIFDEPGSIATIRVSQLNNSTQANGNSSTPSISANGRYISFWSEASNLVANDTNNAADIFTYDRQTGNINRVLGVSNVQPAGGNAARISNMSGNGDYVAFESAATNLVASDTNGVGDVFIAKSVLPAPSDLVATPVSQNQINLTWSYGGGASSFTLERSDNGGSSWQVLSDNIASNVRAYADSSGLAKCTTHLYRIFAVSGGEKSLSSNVATANTLGCPPYAFKLVSPASSSIIINPASLDDFTWEASFEAATYTFTLTNIDSSTTVANITSDAATICTATLCSQPIDTATQALLINGNYRWTVSATNTEGTTVASNTPFSFVVNDVLPPRDFVLRTPTQNGVLRSVNNAAFTWKANKDAATFEFHLFKLSNDPGRELGLVYSDLDLTPDADSTDTLTCAESVGCTLTADSTMIAQLTEGLYSWTVIAKSPAGTPTEAENAAFVFSVVSGSIDILTNGSFETDTDPANKIPDGWMGVNLTKDKLLCNTLTKVFAFDGDCAFRFKGSTGEASVLNHKPDFAPYNLVGGDTLTLNAHLRASNQGAGAKIQLKVVYTGTTFLPDKVNLTPQAGSYDYTLLNGTVTLDTTVKKIVLKIANKSTTGNLYVDNVKLLLSGAGRRGKGRGAKPVTQPTGDGFLPLPEAPRN